MQVTVTARRLYTLRYARCCIAICIDWSEHEGQAAQRHQLVLLWHCHFLAAYRPSRSL